MRVITHVYTVKTWITIQEAGPAADRKLLRYSNYKRSARGADNLRRCLVLINVLSGIDSFLMSSYDRVALVSAAYRRSARACVPTACGTCILCIARPYRMSFCPLSVSPSLFSMHYTFQRINIPGARRYPRHGTKRQNARGPVSAIDHFRRRPEDTCVLKAVRR